MLGGLVTCFVKEAVTAGGAAANAEAGGGDTGAQRDDGGGGWGALPELPVEIELPPDLRFHSVFACPVSREQATYPHNPPMMLPCGHALCREALLGMARRTRVKCPYCPSVSATAAAIELKL